MTKFIKKPQTVIVNEPEIQLSGDILFNNNKKHVEQAKKQLQLAHEIEAEKIKQGYKYMRKEKTAKLVDPDKIKALKLDGWKLVNQKLKPKKSK